MASPPFWQPKQWKSFWPESTLSDGERSSWNGHSPEYRPAPARLSSVRVDTRSTMSTASRTRSTDSFVYRAKPRPRLRGEALRDGQTPERGDRVAVGHPGQVVGDPLWQVGPGRAAAVGQE